MLGDRQPIWNLDPLFVSSAPSGICTLSPGFLAGTTAGHQVHGAFMITRDTQGLALRQQEALVPFHLLGRSDLHHFTPLHSF